MQGLYATGVAAVALGIARAMLSEFITLATRKAPRGLARLADNASHHHTERSLAREHLIGAVPYVSSEVHRVLLPAVGADARAWNRDT
jgi:hypothetical protein